MEHSCGFVKRLGLARVLAAGCLLLGGAAVAAETAPAAAAAAAGAEIPLAAQFSAVMAVTDVQQRMALLQALQPKIPADDPVLTAQVGQALAAAAAQYNREQAQKAESLRAEQLAAREAAVAEAEKRLREREEQLKRSQNDLEKRVEALENKNTVTVTETVSAPASTVWQQVCLDNARVQQEAAALLAAQRAQSVSSATTVGYSYTTPSTVVVRECSPSTVVVRESCPVYVRDRSWVPGFVGGVIGGAISSGVRWHFSGPRHHFHHPPHHGHHGHHHHRR